MSIILILYVIYSNRMGLKHCQDLYNCGPNVAFPIIPSGSRNWIAQRRSKWPKHECQRTKGVGFFPIAFSCACFFHHIFNFLVFTPRSPIIFRWLLQLLNPCSNLSARSFFLASIYFNTFLEPLTKCCFSQTPCKDNSAVIAQCGHLFQGFFLKRSNLK